MRFILIWMNELVIRLLVAFILSSFFGLERQRAHKQVGFGTFIFVATSSCALTITSLQLSPDNIGFLGAIMTGIGFLGAGALIKSNDKIYGFTTAASIWVFAALGLLIGVGEYLFGGILYVIIWIVVLYDRHMEEKGLGSYRTRLTLKTNRICSQEEIMNFLNSVGVKKTKLMRFELDSKNNICVFNYFIEGKTKSIQLIPKLVKRKKWISSVEFD